MSFGFGAAHAEDWPSYRHDHSRSGTTAEQLDPAALEQAWVHQSAQPPAPAWPGPAKWDAYAGIKNLPSMRNYDPCYHVIAAGGAVYFGSSTDDAVHKLDATTGQVLWSFPTGGPIRVAPTLDQGKLYFGSDDGFAYCVDARTGDLVWSYCPMPDADKVWNNGRAISFYPVRTGVVVLAGKAYFGASLLPWKQSLLIGVDAVTGRPEGAGTFVQRFEGQTMEGAMLATDGQLILPQGRVAPKLYDRATGQSQGALAGSGGVFVVITPDQHILHGPGGRSARTGGISDSSGSTAKIAAFEKGNALVVSGNWAFLLQAGQVLAIDRAQGTIVWQQPHDGPLDLVLAGDTLFVGSEDRVTAYATADGTITWTGEVHGSAHGLAVANGALLVSTDQGAIHCFRATGDADRPATGDDDADEQALASPAVDRVRARGLIGRWVMHRSAMRTPAGESVSATSFNGVVIRDQAGNQHAVLTGDGVSQRFGGVEAMALDGKSYLMLADNVAQAQLPQRRFSVEAWVRVDAPLPWGGIIGCLQDNGSFERGWLLGYRDDKFCFGLKAQGGKDALTYLSANTAYTPGGWAHVVATYDGSTMRLYLNGRVETSSAEQSGDVHYAPSGPYVIGGYRDDNEDFRMTGMIHEVRVYDTVLRDRDVLALFTAKSENFPEPSTGPEDAGNFLASGPAVRFLGPGTAEVTWQTHRPSTSAVTFVRDDLTIQAEEGGRRTEHKLIVTGLRARSVYQFQVTEQTSDGPRTTRSFECDTYFNYGLAPLITDTAPYPQAADTAAAVSTKLAEALPAERGIVLIAGFDDARHGYALAAASQLSVLVVVDSPEVARAERKKLIAAGAYGERVTVMSAGELGELRLPPHAFNAAMVPADAADDDRLMRQVKILVQPGDGIVMTEHGQVLYTAPPLPGAGTWSHMYGTAENTSFGGEELGGASNIDQLEVQWVGRPGPRYQSDRQNRKPAPLAAGGRLYLQGLHRLITVDQYNGTILWSMEVPEMQRWNVTRDCANWCADEDNLYVAVLGEVWQIDGVSGEILHKWPAVGNRAGERNFDFGFVARAGEGDTDLLIGSSVRPGAIFTEWWGGENWYDQSSGEKAGKVGSDKLFALDPVTGKQRWTHDRGVVLNATICVTQDRVFFIRSTNPAIINGEPRRLFTDALWEGLELVTLDLRSGRELESKPVSPMPGVTAFYMVYADNKLVISSSANNQFAMYCLDAQTGTKIWDAQFAWEADHHGKHLSRPAISGNYVYLRPKVLDLQTGSEYNVQFPPGHQCGTYALTTQAWFARAGSMTMWSIDQQEVSRWDRLRSDCWLSTIPAGGMLLSPEGGGGCSCGSWMETSMGFMPRNARDAQANDTEAGDD